MKHRRGTSLVELLLVMSACTVILTLSAELIHRVMLVQAKSTAFFNAERSAQRLSVAFRHDVHQATERSNVDSDMPNHSLLQLVLPENQTVEYRQAAGTIERILREGDSIAAREQFPFQEGIIASVEEEPAGALVLSIQTPIKSPNLEDPQPRAQASIIPLNLNVQAVLNRYPRLRVSNAGDRSAP